VLMGDNGMFAPSGQDYTLADGQSLDGGWASRRADIMNRANVNSQLKEVDKVERRMKCQQEEFLGALKQHESDKLALGKYLKELEVKNEELMALNATLEVRAETAENQADNYKLAFEEFKEERESLLKYWKQDQAKLAKLVGPNYDEIEINDVRLMDLATVESMGNQQASKILQEEVAQPGLSPFQKRMQERTRGLQASLANETSIVYRVNPDGSLKPPSPKAMAAMPKAADPDKTQCYWSPIEGRFVPMSKEEKKAATAQGAALSKAVLQQESDEVRTLQRRVAELEFMHTSAGITEEEVDSLRGRVHEATMQIDAAEARALDAERRSQQLQADLVVQKQQGGPAGGNDAQTSQLRDQVVHLAEEVKLERQEKLRITEEAAQEKQMFIDIATGLEQEVKETKQAMEQVLEEYPHLKTMVNQQLPAYR